MQIAFELNLHMAFAAGVLMTALILIPLATYMVKRKMTALKVDMMQRLPMTIEKIDADKEVMRAHHMIELRQLELRIAQAYASEAEAHAMATEGLGRIDKLNRRIEVMQLKLAARNKNKEIRKIDEKLLLLDEADNPIEANLN